MLRSRATATGFAFALLASACSGTATDAETSSLQVADQQSVAAPESQTPSAEAPEETAPLADPEPAADDTAEDAMAAEEAPAEPTAQPAADASAAVDDSAAAEDAAAEPAAPPVATVPLPDINVVNLLTGENDSLKNLERPGATLLWFWAPH